MGGHADIFEETEGVGYCGELFGFACAAVSWYGGFEMRIGDCVPSGRSMGRRCSLGGWSGMLRAILQIVAAVV